MSTVPGIIFGPPGRHEDVPESVSDVSELPPELRPAHVAVTQRPVVTSATSKQDAMKEPDILPTMADKAAASKWEILNHKSMSSQFSML